MKRLNSTFRVLVVAWLIGGLMVLGVCPVTSASGRVAENGEQVKHNGCCAANVARCCGTACCKAPVQKQPTTTAPDDRDVKRVKQPPTTDAVAARRLGEAKSAGRHAALQTDDAFAHANWTLQIQHVRLQI